MLEVLSVGVDVVDQEREDVIVSTIQRVEKVLVKPGWSALGRVSIGVSIRGHLPGRNEKLSKALRSLSKKCPKPHFKARVH